MAVLYNCGLAAAIRILTSKKNPNRRYYVCQHWKPRILDGCGFFEWIDPPASKDSSRVESEGNIGEQTVEQYSISNEILQDIARIKHNIRCIRLKKDVTNILLFLIVILLVLLLIVLS